MKVKAGHLTVRDLIEKYKKGEIGIPEFQRNYVWKEERILKLIDSLYKHYPIGALIIWTPEIDEKIKSKDKNVGRPLQWLIDGQQRTKSLVNAIDEDSSIFFNPVTEVFKIINCGWGRTKTTL